MKKNNRIIVLFWLMVPVICSAGFSNLVFTLGITRPLAPTDVKNSYLSGAHLGAMAGIAISSNLELMADLSYHAGIFDVRGFKTTLPEDDKEDYVITGSNAHFFTAMLKARWFMSASKEIRQRSYLFAGPGLLLSKRGEISWLHPAGDGKISAKNEITAGVTFGLGVELAVESTRFVIELGPVLGFTDETTVLLPVRLGVALNL
jgi:hypothetical protein